MAGSPKLSFLRKALSFRLQETWLAGIIFSFFGWACDQKKKWSFSLDVSKMSSHWKYPGFLFKLCLQPMTLGVSNRCAHLKTYQKLSGRCGIRRPLLLHLSLPAEDKHGTALCWGSRVGKSSQMLGPQTQQSSVWLSQPDHSHFSGLHDTASSKWLSAVIKANWSASYSPTPVIRLPVLMSHQSTEKCDLHKSHQFLCS